MKHMIITTDNAERVEMVNGRSVRTWQESRGQKTITKRFFLKYELHVERCGRQIGDHHVSHTKYDTIKEVSEARAQVMNMAEERDNISSWINLDNSPLTHMSEFGFAVSDQHNPNGFWKVWVTREGGELISEIIEQSK